MNYFSHRILMGFVGMLSIMIRTSLAMRIPAEINISKAKACYSIPFTSRHTVHKHLPQSFSHLSSSNFYVRQKLMEKLFLELLKWTCVFFYYLFIDTFISKINCLPCRRRRGVRWWHTEWAKFEAMNLISIAFSAKLFYYLTTSLSVNWFYPGERKIMRLNLWPHDNGCWRGQKGRNTKANFFPRYFTSTLNVCKMISWMIKALPTINYDAKGKGRICW